MVQITRDEYNKLYNSKNKAQQATIDAAIKAGNITISEPMQVNSAPVSNQNKQEPISTTQTTTVLENTGYNPKAVLQNNQTNLTAGTTVQKSSALQTPPKVQTTTGAQFPTTDTQLKSSASSALDRELQKNQQEFLQGNPGEGYSNVNDYISDIARKGQLYDRTIENLEDQKNQAIANIDQQLESQRQSVARQTEDLRIQAARNKAYAEKLGALSGRNMSDAFDRGVKAMEDDNLRTINNLQQAYNNIVDSAAEDKAILLYNWGKAKEQAKQDFDYEMRDLMQMTQINVADMLERYGLSSEQFTRGIDVLSENYFAKNQEALDRYIATNKAINDNAFADVQKLMIINDYQNKIYDRTYNELVKDGGQPLLTYSVSDIRSLTDQGYITPQQGLQLINLQKQKAVNTLNTLKGVEVAQLGSLFAQEIEQGINSGKTPQQVLADIINMPKFRQAIETMPLTAEQKAQLALSQANLQKVNLENQLTATELASLQDIGGNYYSGDLTQLNIDLSSYKDQYPGEASLPNNNPAGITFNNSFAQRLDEAGIPYEKGGNRPKNEGGNYFKFPTIGDGFKAYNLLWGSGTYQSKNVKDALKTWKGFNLPGADEYAQSIAGQAGVDLNKKVSELSPQELQSIQLAQIKRESPGLSKTLQSVMAQTPGTVSDTYSRFYDPGLLATYTAYIESNKVPTEKQIKALGGLDNFARDAHKAYIENENKKLQAQNFELVDPGFYSTMDKEQRKLFNSDTRTINNTIQKIDNIIEKLNAEGLPTAAGTTLGTGKAKEYKQLISDLQLQLKNEGVYNLGVLNGPDLDIINSVIPQIGYKELANGKDGYIKLLNQAKKLYIDQINTQNSGNGIRYTVNVSDIGNETNIKGKNKALELMN